MLNLEATPFFATGTSTNTQAHPKRWDHSGYDQLQKEEDQGTWHQIKNPKKQKGTVEGEHNKRQGQKNHAKWLNNKQEDDLSAKVFNEVKNGGKGAKKDRKPDRQLYSVRDKRGDGQTQNSGTRNNNTRKTKGGNSFVPPLNVMKESEGPAFDDDKSFVSNVSTAISERLKNIDEDRDENQEKVALTSNNPSQNTLPNAPEETILLFNLCLGSGDRFETIFIYEGEQNYENLLDEICARHEIVERNAVYFKINVLQMIMNAHSNPSAVEPTLNKLLDINYNILLSEFEQEVDDASPLFFGESDSFLTENNPEDSC